MSWKTIIWTLLVLLAAFLLLQRQPSQRYITSQHPTSWNVYRNQSFGVAFKYPNSLNVVENYFVDIGERVDLIPATQQTENSTTIKPIISLWITCLIPENVPRESWRNNFQKPIVSGGPLDEGLKSRLLESYEIGARTLFVFNQGCYECYDGWDPNKQRFTPNPDKAYDGFSAYSCEAGLNKNGNKAAQCLTMVTERQKRGSPELEQLKDFLLGFIPTLKLQQGLTIQDCEGLGESVG